jgi:hypothetical protein
MAKFRDRFRDWLSSSEKGTNDQPSSSPSVEWAEVKEPISGPTEPTVLPGSLDPVCACELKPGEKIHLCTNCRTGYHKDCWEFLKRWNASRCVTCSQWGTFITMTVPAALPKAAEKAEEEKVIIACPRCGAPNRIRTGRPVSGYRCGKCLEPLFSSMPSSPPAGGQP